jgi:hypothetical protein
MSSPAPVASRVRTPLNPSKRAILRVTNPLPVPDTCPYCGKRVNLVNNAEIYGCAYGEWPWAYACEDRRGCNSYVGLHPFTHIPVGTLADAPTRKARQKAKSVFNPIWQGGKMTRKQAYATLAKAMGIPVDSCHMGWFSVADCERVFIICTQGQQ